MIGIAPDEAGKEADRRKRAALAWSHPHDTDKTLQGKAECSSPNRAGVGLEADIAFRGKREISHTQAGKNQGLCHGDEFSAKAQAL
jgi:hypothetical protein